jgi:hypothetical protein
MLGTFLNVLTFGLGSTSLDSSVAPRSCIAVVVPTLERSVNRLGLFRTGTRQSRQVGSHCACGKHGFLCFLLFVLQAD